MQLSDQQELAIKAVRAWLKDPNSKQVFKLFGYAGTGKSTIAKLMAEEIGSVAFGAFTAVAAKVMREKGCVNSTTIHALIYIPIDPDDGKKGSKNKAENPIFILNRTSPVQNVDLIIIDECSMVGETMGKDLESFGVKILVLGDSEQLPAIEGSGYFTNGLPDFMLTEIHRQALDNPIIALSMAARERVRIDFGQYGTSSVIRRTDLTDAMLMGSDMILAGRNMTRRYYNEHMRKLLGRTSKFPEKDDRLVCLRNDNQLGIYNGEVWTARAAAVQKNNYLHMEITNENKDCKKVKVREDFFTNPDNIPWELRKKSHEFDFGNVLTCHKAQGSQWNNVLIFDESACFREHSSRWLYTAISRGVDTITLVR